MSNVQHSRQIGYGARAVAKKDGIEVRKEISEVQDEIIGTISWKQIEHLRSVSSQD